MSLASVTICRQPVSPPVLEPTPERDPSAAIVAEIAERLEELDELKRESAADLVLQLAGIASSSRRAFRVTVQLLHGRVDEVLASYQDQADKRGVTKQDIHYEFRQEIGRLQLRYPRLYQCIMQMRAQAMQHEDPIEKLQVATPHGGAFGGGE